VTQVKRPEPEKVIFRLWGPKICGVAVWTLLNSETKPTGDLHACSLESDTKCGTIQHRRTLVRCERTVLQYFYFYLLSNLPSWVRFRIREGRKPMQGGWLPSRHSPVSTEWSDDGFCGRQRQRRWQNS